jgi:hypothetical protein
MRMSLTAHPHFSFAVRAPEYQITKYIQIKIEILKQNEVVDPAELCTHNDVG